MDGDKSGESGAFLFSRPSQISATIPDKWKLRFVQSGTSTMDFALYQSLSHSVNMASLENTSDCYLESLAQEGRKNDMVFLVGFCLSRIEILALTSERTQMYWERRSISSCASMLLYKCCYICVQDSIFGALSISRQIHNREKNWSRLLAIIRYIGKIWDGRQKVESLLVWDFPNIWKTGFIRYTGRIWNGW